MTPQERLELETQHQRRLTEAVEGRDPKIDNSWPKVYELWLKHYAALVEAEWSAAIDRGLPPREVHAHLVKTKRDLLRFAAWNDLMPPEWKHCWLLRPKEMPALRRYLNRHLTADISRLVNIAYEHEKTKPIEERQDYPNLERLQTSSMPSPDMLTEMQVEPSINVLTRIERNVPPNEKNPKRPPSCAKPSPASWDQLEITFLCDHRVQIRIGAWSETLNYNEFGFGDKRGRGRGDNPNRQWSLLRDLAQANGTLPKTDRKGGDLGAFEKKIERIRKVIQKYCPQTKGDPLPCEDQAYKALCKINCSASFKT
ncbi:MAG: hypothetical protein ACR2JB_22070 [Bryobacteraceae bacterium]